MSRADKKIRIPNILLQNGVSKNVNFKKIKRSIHFVM